MHTYTMDIICEQCKEKTNCITCNKTLHKKTNKRRTILKNMQEGSKENKKD